MPEVVFDCVKIQEILPHRYPFLMVDRVIEFVANQSIVAEKAVTVNEPYFVGHFPGKPVMPGVMVLEAIAQVAAILAKKSPDGIPPEKLIYLVGADKFRWKRMVVPGDVLRIEVKFQRVRRPIWNITGEVTVEGKLVCSGEVMAAEG